MAIETQIIEVTSTDRDFLCRLIDWLNDAVAKESSTVVRLRDGHAAFTEDELTRLLVGNARLTIDRDRLRRALSEVLVETNFISLRAVRSYIREVLDEPESEAPE